MKEMLLVALLSVSLLIQVSSSSPAPTPTQTTTSTSTSASDRQLDTTTTTTRTTTTTTTGARQDHPEQRRHQQHQQQPPQPQQPQLIRSVNPSARSMMRPAVAADNENESLRNMAALLYQAARAAGGANRPASAGLPEVLAEAEAASSSSGDISRDQILHETDFGDSLNPRQQPQQQQQHLEQQQLLTVDKRSWQPRSGHGRTQGRLTARQDEVMSLLLEELAMLDISGSQPATQMSSQQQQQQLAAISSRLRGRSAFLLAGGGGGQPLQQQQQQQLQQLQQRTVNSSGDQLAMFRASDLDTGVGAFPKRTTNSHVPCFFNAISCF